MSNDPLMVRKMMPGVDVVVLRGYQKDRYGVVLEEQVSSHYVRYVLLDGEGEGEEFSISDLGLCGELARNAAECNR